MPSKSQKSQKNKKKKSKKDGSQDERQTEQTTQQRITELQEMLRIIESGDGAPMGSESDIRSELETLIQMQEREAEAARMADALIAADAQDLAAKMPTESAPKSKFVTPLASASPSDEDDEDDEDDNDDGIGMLMGQASQIADRKKRPTGSATDTGYEPPSKEKIEEQLRISQRSLYEISQDLIKSISIKFFTTGQGVSVTGSKSLAKGKEYIIGLHVDRKPTAGARVLATPYNKPHRGSHFHLWRNSGAGTGMGVRIYLQLYNIDRVFSIQQDYLSAGRGAQTVMVTERRDSGNKAGTPAQPTQMPATIDPVRASQIASEVINILEQQFGVNISLVGDRQDLALQLSAYIATLAYLYERGEAAVRGIRPPGRGGKTRKRKRHKTHRRKTRKHKTRKHKTRKHKTMRRH